MKKSAQIIALVLLTITCITVLIAAQAHVFFLDKIILKISKQPGKNQPAPGGRYVSVSNNTYTTTCVGSCGAVTTSAVPPVQTGASIDVPDNWTLMPQTEQFREKHPSVAYYFRDKETRSGVLVSTVPRDIVQDMATWSESHRVIQSKKLTGAQVSALSAIDVNGVAAWRYEIAGTVSDGRAMTYMTTTLDGEKEAVVVSAWVPTETYETQGRQILQKISDSVTGIASTKPGIDLDGQQAIVTNTSAAESKLDDSRK